MKQKIELDYGKSCGDPTLHYIRGLHEEKEDGYYLRFDWDAFDIIMFFSDPDWLREIASTIYKRLDEIGSMNNSSEQTITEDE